MKKGAVADLPWPFFAFIRSKEWDTSGFSIGDKTKKALITESLFADRTGLEPMAINNRPHL